MVRDADRVKSIFLAAVERHAADQWPAYLDGACGDDAELRGRVERLLAAHGDQNSLHVPSPSESKATVDQTPLERPGGAVGPYKLMEELGEGGMGVVYVAEQAQPVRRKVALKVIKPGMDSKQVVARFEAERQALAMMDHPNIARVFDAGTTGSGRPYFVMELVRGIPITEYCDREGLSIPDRLDLFVLVCRAVQHAHQKGVIHRDLKPSNILVTVVDGAAVPKVIDFGVAKATGAALTDRTVYTGFHQMVGTPLYMSPEQADLSGVDVDTRSDIYALGVLLYELLTGTTPFDPETLRRAAFDEVRRIIREDEPPRPSTRLGSLGATLTTVSARRKSDPRRLGSTVRGELDWVVMKALEKDRKRRYETANDFAADVMCYLSDRPVEACPPSATYRLAKFARRNRTILIGSAILATALVAGTVVSTWQAVVAARARRETAEAFATARRAVDEMYSQFAETWIARQPKLTRIQRDFAEKALAFYEQFAGQMVDDPRAQFDAALARRRVGTIRRKLGKVDGARTALWQSVDQLDQLAARFPDRADYLSELAESLVNLGSIQFEVGLPGEASRFLNRAVEVHDQAMARDPTDREQRARLASSLAALGSLYERRGLNPQAELILRRAKDLYASLGTSGTLGPGHRVKFANCDCELGYVYTATGRLPEAELAFGHAAGELQSLLAEDPGDPACRKSLANALANLAMIQQDTGRRAEAMATRRRAMAILDALSVEFPDVPEYRRLLATCHLDAITQLVREGGVDEVERLVRRAVELVEGLIPDHAETSEHRRALAGILCRLADLYSTSPDAPSYNPARALELARRASELGPYDMGLARQSMGWARYRSGDWRGCIESLEGHQAGDFFAAMAHRHLGDEAKAREIFLRADAWLAGYEQRWRPGVYPDPSMLRRFRAEAAALLGIEPPPGAANPP